MSDERPPASVVTRRNLFKAMCLIIAVICGVAGCAVFFKSVKPPTRQNAPAEGSIPAHASGFFYLRSYCKRVVRRLLGIVDHVELFDNFHPVCEARADRGQDNFKSDFEEIGTND
jgi:hypothetical protein